MKLEFVALYSELALVHIAKGRRQRAEGRREEIDR